MRTRKLLAALGVGVLAALALGTSAQATVGGTVTAPTVTFDDQCTKGNFKITASLPAGAAAVSLKLLFAGNNYGLAGLNPGQVLNAGEKVDLSVVGKTTEGSLLWKAGESADYAPLASHTWKLNDGKCKPTVTDFQPSCTNPNLGVAILNPAEAGGTIEVTFNGNVKKTVAAGDFVLYDQVVKNDIAYTWHSKALDVSGEGTVKYQTPTGCSPEQPGSNPPANNGNATTGRGKPQHVVYVFIKDSAGTNQQGTATPKPTTSATNKALPVTGSNTGTIAAVGGLLLGAGIICLVAVRRRSSTRFTA